MAPRWLDSAGKHGIPHQDQVHAMLHATYSIQVPGQSRLGGDVWLFIGPAHAQSRRELEILVRVFSDGREATVFHAMELGPKHRRYREENPHE